VPKSVRIPPGPASPETRPRPVFADRSPRGGR
jgi:hypothetical protein